MYLWPQQILHIHISFPRMNSKGQLDYPRAGYSITYRKLGIFYLYIDSQKYELIWLSKSISWATIIVLTFKLLGALLQLLTAVYNCCFYGI